MPPSFNRGLIFKFKKMETVKTLVVGINHEETTLNLKLGIGEERKEEILDWMKENLEEKNAAVDIEKVINHFEKPEELTFALYSIKPYDAEQRAEEKKPGLTEAV